MTKATLNIKQWGNSLGVRLLAAVARAAKLHAGQRIRMTAKCGKVIIEPINNSMMGLAERLATYDISKHGGEVMAATLAGAEQ
jgi:antitoxin MazE